MSRDWSCFAAENSHSSDRAMIYFCFEELGYNFQLSDFVFFVLIQIWDLASGTLKLSLTGHISAVRGVVVSPRQPYLFSCGEDKKVMCWDLEYNKVKLT